MFPHPQPDLPKDTHAATHAALQDTTKAPDLKARVMADAQAQAAQERFRRLSSGYEQRRDSNPLSKGINP